MMHSKRTGALPGLPECAEVYFRCVSSLDDQNYAVKGVKQQTCEDFRAFSWPPFEVLMQFWFITFCVLFFCIRCDNQNVVPLMPHKLTVSLPFLPPVLPLGCSWSLPLLSGWGHFQRSGICKGMPVNLFPIHYNVIILNIQVYSQAFFIMSGSSLSDVFAILFCN